MLTSALVLALSAASALADDATPDEVVPASTGSPAAPVGPWREVVPTPVGALVLAVGLGDFEVSGRVRTGHLAFEPRIATRIDIGTPSNSFGFPSSYRGVKVQAGLDLRGLPVLDRRWEVSALIGVAWVGSIQSGTRYLDESPDEEITSLGHQLALRVGAGIAYRPAAWSSIGVDLVGAPLVVDVAPSLNVDGSESTPTDWTPGASGGAYVGFMARWILWLDPRAGE